MPKISVALITKRTGGIDVAKYSLSRQTFKDFEFLLIDELYRKRHDLVERYFHGSGIDLVHIDASKQGHPKWKPWDYTVGRSCNLGLAYASGELMIVSGDYWVYCPTVLEATWKAWETWGRGGLTVTLAPAASHDLSIKPHFLKYCSERKGIWTKQGASSFLDASPDTYISIYSRDFGEKPSLRKTSDDPRIPSTRIDGTMRDPRPSDPQKYRTFHWEGAGRFKYWEIGSGAAWGLIMPVEDAVKVNGWTSSFNGKWGGWEEINRRMEHVFKHRYICTMGALAYQLPQDFDIVSWVLRSRGKSNKGRPSESFPYGQVIIKLQTGQYQAENPFNMAEERRKIRETGKTAIFDY